MLDLVLPPAIALLGAVIAALPLYAARRGVRVPSGIRIAGVFFAIWGARDIAYGVTADPVAAIRIAAGATALAAGVWVVALTLSKKNNSTGRSVGPALLGVVHLALTAVDVFF